MSLIIDLCPLIIEINLLMLCSLQALMHRDLVAMALQICQGIAYLHDKRVIHRDIATRNCV